MRSLVLPVCCAAVLLVGCGTSPVTRADASIRTTKAVTTTTAPWDVPVSRSDVIAKAIRIADGDDGSIGVSAKLMTYGDFRNGSEPGVVTPGTPDSAQLWAVKVTGKLSVPRAGPCSWVIWTFDAHDGSAGAFVAGPPGTSPSYWDALPDHSSA
jgi:hypothetical protein